MLDIEYLATPRSFDGPLIYRYRTGSFYVAMRAAVEASLGASRNLSDGLGSNYGGLFDKDISFFDWRDTRSNSQIVSSVIASLPETHLVLFAQDDCPIFRGKNWPAVSSHCLVVDETVATAETVSALTKYLDANSALGSNGVLSSQVEFLRYFVDFVGSEAMQLCDFIHAFNEAILLHVDRQTTIFDATAAPLSAPKRRNEIAKHLDELLGRADGASIMALTRALAKRYPSADRGARILCDLAERAISKLTKIALKAAQRPPSFLAPSPARSTLIWIGLMCAWSTPIRDELTSQQQFGLYPSLSLLRLFQMLIDLHARLVAVENDDPFHGLWRRIDRSIAQREKGGPLDELLSATMKFLDQVQFIDARWVNSFKMHLQRRFGPMPVSAVTRSTVPVDEGRWPAILFGLDSFRDFIASRSAAGRDAVPLVLVGEPGLGKRTLGRYYAMAMVCNHPTSKPCVTHCHACRNILGDTSFDLLPFDASKLAADSSIEFELTKKLDHLRTAIRDKQLTVLLYNAAHISLLLSRYLKTLESATNHETWILCVNNLNELNPALISRSDVWRIKPLTKDEATSVVRELSSGTDLDSRLVEIIARAGAGSPARLQQLTSIVLAASAYTIEQGRASLGLDWGGPLLGFCEYLLGKAPATSPDFSRFASIVTRERLETVLSEMRLTFLGGDPGEPAFLHLEGAPLDRLVKMVENNAACNEQPWLHSWEKLCVAWTADDLVEENGLSALVARSHAVFRAAP
jgi:hypothetical protein